jgi:hypothetical protein
VTANSFKKVWESCRLRSTRHLVSSIGKVFEAVCFQQRIAFAIVP